MHRATRLIPPLRQSLRSSSCLTIPHAGPSNLSRRVLSTTQITPPIGPFSALHRSNRRETPSAFVPRPSAPKAIGEEAAFGEDPDMEEYQRDPVLAADDAQRADEGSLAGKSSIDDSVTPGHEGVEAAVEASEAEGTAAVPADAEYWDEKLDTVETDDFTADKADEIAQMTARFDKDLDPALKPWTKPVKPREIIPGEPIILPLSSLGASDPTKPVKSGLAVSLPPQLFGSPVRRDILHACIVWWRTTTRLGTHKNKGRGEVAFSGRKLRPQKKTGRARLGSAGSPMLRKGGVAHAKTPRDYATELPRKVRAMGMRMALSAKLFMSHLRIVENLNEGGWIKTKDAVQGLLAGHKPARPEDQEGGKPRKVWSDGFANNQKDLSILFLHPPTKSAGEIWDFARPLRNIPGVEIMSTDQVEVYHVLHYKWVVMEAGCIDAIAQHAGQIPSEPVEFPEAQVVKPGAEEAGVDAALSNPAAPQWRPGMIEKQRPQRTPTHKPMPAETRWILEGWRKIRGRKSLRKTFGQKNADAYQLKAKRAWKMIRRSGRWATPERVALEINAGRVGGRRAVTAVRN